MKLTTKGRYAVTAMLDVALNAGPEPVSLADIARRQGLSLSYLEQLFARLRRDGLVESSRGPGGGYRLSRPAAEITVAQVIAAVDESVDVTLCGGRANCNQNSRCLTHDLWTELSAKLHEFLDQRSLADVLARSAKPVECSLDRAHAGRVHGDVSRKPQAVIFHAHAAVPEFPLQQDSSLG